MRYGKLAQFYQHRSNMVKHVPFRYNHVCIILAVLQSIDVGLYTSIIVFLCCCLSVYLLVFPAEYRLNSILLRNLATCTLRQHVESNSTPKLGGSSVVKEQVITDRWLIYLIFCCTLFAMCCYDRMFSSGIIAFLYCQHNCSPHGS